MKAQSEWKRLDNAAKIFPANSSGRDPKVFRFVCELTEPVCQQTLQQAAEQTLAAFPFFRFTMRRGVFWYYLEDHVGKMPDVQEESEPPCQPLYSDASSPLFRVLYYRSRISLEVYHAISDGAGAMQFHRTLVANYLRLRYPDAFADASVDLGVDASLFQKMNDSFDTYYTRQGPANKLRERKAYRLRGAKLPGLGMRVVIGEASVKALLAEARARGTTITVLIAACLLCAICEEMPVRYRVRPVVVTVPVNLRNYFESDTARNFFSVVNLGVDFSRTPCTLEDTVKALSEEMRVRLTREHMQDRLNSLAALEHNTFLRAIPLALKDPILNIAGRVADTMSTVSLSNVGKVEMPAAFAPYIRKFDVFISTAGLQICTCSYGDVFSMSFTSAYRATDIERRFFRMLTGMGIDVTISANETEVPL